MCINCARTNIYVYNALSLTLSHTHTRARTRTDHAHTHTQDMQQLCTHRHDLDENGGEVVEVRVQNTLTIAKGHIVSRLAKDSDVEVM